MKKILCFLVFVAVVITFHSCEKEDFDETLLYGRWKQDGSYICFRYDRDRTGVMWNTDPKVDQNEEEGQMFKWKMVQSELEQRHYIEILGEYGIPEFYTITVLNATTLKYKNESKSYTFTKID